MSDFNIQIVLFEPEIPQNTGAIGRICVSLGVRLHLIEPLGFSLEESYVRRAGLDYWKHVDLSVHANWEAFLAAENPQRLFFCSTKGDRSFYDIAYEPNDYLVFGRETNGLPAEFYERYRDNLCIIPMPGKHSRSLNLASAVGIVAYEAYRQLAHE